MPTARPSTTPDTPTAPGYLAHFGLDSAPFSSDNLPFFAGANRGVTLDALLYALTCDESVIKLTGDAGSGKTTLLRLLAQRLPEPSACINLATHAGFSDDDLLNSLAKVLKLKAPPHALPVVMRHLLHEALSARHAQGQATVVLIDDAHLLTHSALEEIGGLSAHETNGHKTLSFVLAGLPELNTSLAHDDVLALKERITHNFTLDALTQSDAAAYLDLRLRGVSHDGSTPIAPAAAHLLGAAAHGSIRQLNQIADQALEAAHTAGHRTVELPDVRALTGNIAFTPEPAAAPHRHRAVFYVGGLIAATALIAAGINLYHSRATQAPPAEFPPVLSVPPQRIATTEPAPTVSTPAEQPQARPEPPAPTTDATPTESLTRQRLNAGRAWLKHASNSHWFIQIVAMDADQTEQIEGFLQKLAQDLPAEQTRAYLGKRDGVPRIGIIYGDFPTQTEALSALSKLPPNVRENQPYIRQVNKIK